MSSSSEAVALPDGLPPIQRTIPSELIRYIIDISGRHAMTEPYMRTSAERDDYVTTLRSLSTLSLLSKDTLDRCRHWVFRRIVLTQKSSGPRNIDTYRAHEAGLIKAAAEFFQRGYIDRLGRRPGDYVLTLSATLHDYPSITHGLRISRAPTIDSTRHVVGAGLSALLCEFHNLQNLQLFGNSSFDQAHLTTIGGTSLCEAISRVPLRKLSIQHLPISTLLLQSLPPTLESLRIEDAEMDDEYRANEYIDVIQTNPLSMGALSGKITLEFVGPELQQVLIAQSKMSPGIFDNINSLSYTSVEGELDLELLCAALARGANTLEDLELCCYYLAEVIDASELCSMLAALPTLPRLRSLTILSPMYSIRDAPGDPSAYGADIIIQLINSLKFTVASITTLNLEIHLGTVVFHEGATRYVSENGEAQVTNPAASLPNEDFPVINPRGSGLSELDEVLSDRIKVTSLEMVRLDLHLQMRGTTIAGAARTKQFHDQMVRQLDAAFDQTRRRLGADNARIKFKPRDPEAVFTLDDFSDPDEWVFWCPG